MPVDGELLRQCGNQGMQLFNRLFALEAECNQLIEIHKQQRIAALEPQHEALIVERRAHGQRLDDLRDEEAKLNGHARSIDQRLREAQLALKLLQDHPPLEAFALKAEIAEHHRKVAAAQDRLNVVLKEQSTHNATVHAWKQRADTGNQRLAELNGQVENAWRELQRLKGLPVPRRRDAATGLPLP